MNTPVNGQGINYKRLGFLASHRGSNMQAIIDACKDGRLAAIPAVVISNNGASGALDRANAEGIPAYHVSSRNYPDPAMLAIAIRDILIKEQVDLVILAGFMKKIGPATLAAFSNRILNIHPSLLPRHGGPGMYGMNVHARVLESGDAETGATVHVVAGDYDSGPVLAQRKVAVHKGDTVESLAARVLEVEHALYIDTLAAIISGDISLNRQ